jgi:hypothetical protein
MKMYKENLILLQKMTKWREHESNMFGGNTRSPVEKKEKI